MSIANFFKRTVIVLMAAGIISFSLTGCEALIEQGEPVKGRTTGKARYIGFDNLTDAYGVGRHSPMEEFLFAMAEWRLARKTGMLFVNKTKEPTPCSIRIMQWVNLEEYFFRDLIFDGESYRMIISTDPDTYDFTYSYLMDLTGRRNKNYRSSRLVFLTDEEEVTFEEAINETSKSKAEQDFDFQIVFRER